MCIFFDLCSLERTSVRSGNGGLFLEILLTRLVSTILATLRTFLSSCGMNWKLVSRFEMPLNGLYYTICFIEIRYKLWIGWIFISALLSLIHFRYFENHVNQAL